MRKEKGGKREKKKTDERQEEREKEGGEVEERMEEGTQETEERLKVTEEACEGEVRGGFRESLGSKESQGLCNFHRQPRNCNCGVCEGASRALRQGACTFPRQTEGGSLGRNLCRTEAPAL